MMDDNGAEKRLPRAGDSAKFEVNLGFSNFD